MQAGNHFEVHAENAGNQSQRRKDGGNDRQRLHNLVGAMADRAEVQLHRSFN